MKILGGKFKSRKIEVPPGIRPVAQRVKKSCFDILLEVIKGKFILDLYAGSGSLGIEALSRGARKSVFVDKSRKKIKIVEKNLIKLKIKPKSQLFCQDSFLAMENFYRKKIFFDLIFLDPPYNEGILTKSLQLLKTYDILAHPGYLVGFCHKNESCEQDYGAFSLVLKRGYGQSVLLVYQKELNG